MNRRAGVLFSAGCIAAILAAFVAGESSAAIVPFDGTGSSWLHVNEKGEPEGYWITQINDTITVRTGDSMQFRNRWYNSYAGTADIRISYGGGQSYTCIGSDEYVFYGLNYGNYYPSGTESVPFYSKVVASQGDPDSLEEYNLVVNHQYVYNGVMFGCNEESDKWLMRFRCSNESGTGHGLEETTGQQNDTEPAATAVSGTAGQSSVVPAVSDMPTLTPTQSTMSPVMLGCALAIAYVIVCYIRKRQE